jgi:hypothetical protein
MTDVSAAVLLCCKQTLHWQAATFCTVLQHSPVSCCHPVVQATSDFYVAAATIMLYASHLLLAVSAAGMLYAALQAYPPPPLQQQQQLPSTWQLLCCCCKVLHCAVLCYD